MYPHVLKALAIGVFGVSLIHIFFGASSEVLLGSQISALSLLDPNLDSQNRFYGAAFALYGAVFWLCSTNIQRHRPFLVAALAVFFLAGLTRLISAFTIGLPTAPILWLTAIELLGPPAMYIWLQKITLGHAASKAPAEQ